MANSGDLLMAAIRYARAEEDAEFTLARRCLAELAVKIANDLPPSPPVLVASAAFDHPHWQRMIDAAIEVADAWEHSACHDGCCVCPSWDEASQRFIVAAERWAKKAKWVPDPWRKI